MKKLTFNQITPDTYRVMPVTVLKSLSRVDIKLALPEAFDPDKMGPRYVEHLTEQLETNLQQYNAIKQKFVLDTVEYLTGVRPNNLPYMQSMGRKQTYEGLDGYEDFSWGDERIIVFVTKQLNRDTVRLYYGSKPIAEVTEEGSTASEDGQSSGS